MAPDKPDASTIAMRTPVPFPVLFRFLLPLFCLFPAAAYGADRIVAIVNNDIILNSELEAHKQRVLRDNAGRGAQIPPERVLREQILERLIEQRLQLQLAAQTGIVTSEEALDQTIANLAERNHLGLAEFRDALLQDGVSFAEFRTEIRNEMTVGQLRQRDILSRIQVSEREIDNFLNAQQASGNVAQKYRIAHILVAFSEEAGGGQKAKAREKADRVHSLLGNGADFASVASQFSDGQTAADGGDLGWRLSSELPAFFTSAVESLKVGEYTQILENESGFHILKLLDTEGAQQHMTQQAKVRHILIRTSELVSDEDALSRLRRLAERLSAGEDFAALASAHSDDFLSAVKGGDLGWVSPGQSSKKFEEAADNLDPGVISQPVRTEYGWHLIQVLERRTLDDTDQHLREKASNQIRMRKAEEQVKNWLQRLRDEAYIEERL